MQSLLGGEGPGYVFDVHYDESGRVLNISDANGGNHIVSGDVPLVVMERLLLDVTRDADYNSDDWWERYRPFFLLHAQVSHEAKRSLPGKMEQARKEGGDDTAALTGLFALSTSTVATPPGRESEAHHHVQRVFFGEPAQEEREKNDFFRVISFEGGDRALAPVQEGRAWMMEQRRRILNDPGAAARPPSPPSSPLISSSQAQAPPPPKKKKRSRTSPGEEPGSIAGPGGNGGAVVFMQERRPLPFAVYFGLSGVSVDPAAADFQKKIEEYSQYFVSTKEVADRFMMDQEKSTGKKGVRVVWLPGVEWRKKVDEWRGAEEEI